MKPFSQDGFWGYGNAWRPYREFVGVVKYGVRYKLWNPEAAVHRQFSLRFRQMVLELLVVWNSEPFQDVEPDSCSEDAVEYPSLKRMKIEQVHQGEGTKGDVAEITEFSPSLRTGQRLADTDEPGTSISYYIKEKSTDFENQNSSGGLCGEEEMLGMLKKKVTPLTASEKKEVVESSTAKPLAGASTSNIKTRDAAEVVGTGTTSKPDGTTLNKCAEDKSSHPLVPPAAAYKTSFRDLPLDAVFYIINMCRWDWAYPLDEDPLTCLENDKAIPRAHFLLRRSIDSTGAVAVRGPGACAVDGAPAPHLGSSSSSAANATATTGINGATTSTEGKGKGKGTTKGGAAGWWFQLPRMPGGGPEGQEGSDSGADRICFRRDRFGSAGNRTARAPAPRPGVLRPQLRGRVRRRVRRRVPPAPAHENVGRTSARSRWTRCWRRRRSCGS